MPAADARPWPVSLAAGGLVLAAFALMYAPVYWRAATGIWQTDEQAHGPLIVAAVLWLAWRVRHAVGAAAGRPQAAAGWALAITGLLMYFVGRSQELTILEFGSQIALVASAILLLLGGSALRAAAVPVAYMIFMIPLPGLLVDAATAPLKQWISSIAEGLLFAADYPIARKGVVLVIGQYQLLVADACSGLHSMFSLAALGALFMILARRPSRLHNLVMLISIVPIAFAANIVRVLALVLVTYHMGDRAAQSFLHGAASIVLFGVAMGLFFALDAALAWFLLRRHAARQGGTESHA